MTVHYEELDDLAPSGVYVSQDGDNCPYNVRKYAEMVKKLGLKSGEQMPDKYLNHCLA